ncbi:15020_t:CDS:2 [Acaulospora colombiana]|uniref:15020_t:CDS:1 n=1 Tax=Acaulospora colombiana TaxID=27376 RepID=A0ACA9LMX4_9GLOM|nr:15020_t:CDS:2 [Acaulospora colombiana]
MDTNEYPEVTIDSLPYIDHEIGYEGMRAKVDKLVEQEMRKRSNSKRDQALNFPSNFEFFKNSPILATEYQRVQQGKAIVEMDTSRYKLSEPDNKEDVESWSKAVDNSKSQLQHQDLRLFNLELLQKYGANAWRLHNFQLEHELQQYQKTLEEYRQSILELNKQRKTEQAGSQIESLELKWTKMIGQTLQVEVACASLESELRQLKQREQELIAQLELVNQNDDDKVESQPNSEDEAEKEKEA